MLFSRQCVSRAKAKGFVPTVICVAAGTCGMVAFSADGLEARRSAQSPMVATSSDLDDEGDFQGQSPTHESFVTDLPGGNVNAWYMRGKNKKQLLLILAVSNPQIVTSSGKYSVTDTSWYDAKSGEFCAVVHDLMEHNTSKKMTMDSMDAQPQMKGLSWGTARMTSPRMTLELRVHDPNSPVGYKSISSVTIHRMTGKDRHSVKFKLTKAALNAIQDNIDGIFVTANVQVRCRIARSEVIAEWNVVSEQSLNAINKLKSAANGEQILFVSTGGEMNADQGLRQYISSYVQASVIVKPGSNVSPEVVAAMMNSAFTNPLVAQKSLDDKGDQFLSVVIGNQVVVNGLRSTISEVIDQTRVAVEKGELDATHRTKEFAAGASASFLGIGGGVNASSGQSDKEERERLLKNMNDASKSFRGNLSGFTTINLNQLSQAIQNASSGGINEIGTFEARDVNFAFDSLIDFANENQIALKKHIARQKAIKEEVRTLQLNCVKEIDSIVASLQEAGTIEEFKATFDSSLEFRRLVAHLEGFRAWGAHNRALGDGRCNDRIEEWLEGSDNGKKRREMCAEREQKLSGLIQQMNSRFEQLKKANTVERLVNQKGSVHLRTLELLDEYETLEVEIKTLRTLGATE